MCEGFIGGEHFVCPLVWSCTFSLLPDTLRFLDSLPGYIWFTFCHSVYNSDITLQLMSPSAVVLFPEAWQHWFAVFTGSYQWRHTVVDPIVCMFRHLGTLACSIRISLVWWHRGSHLHFVAMQVRRAYQFVAACVAEPEWIGYRLGASVEPGGLLLHTQDGSLSSSHSAIATYVSLYMPVASYLLAFVLCCWLVPALLGPQ